MISKTEKNRIIRLKRQANYLRSRAESSDLTNKQKTLAMANANAISWAIGKSIEAIEIREKEFVRDKLIDRILKFLKLRKFIRNRERYEFIEEWIRDLHTSDIMDHEKTFDGLAKEVETRAAAKKDGEEQ